MTRLTFYLFISGTLLTTSASRQVTRLRTFKYAGTYSYGKDVEKEPVGGVIIYPETDSTVLFYLNVCRGASQGYRLGQLYSRLKIQRSGQCTFYEKFEMEEKSCKWTIQFSNDKLVIKTVDDQDGCGFGYGVIADGTYLKTSKEVPDSFVDGHNKKIVFRDTKPETYLK